MLRKPIPENALSCMAYESKFWNGKTAEYVSAGTISHIDYELAISRIIALSFFITLFKNMVQMFPKKWSSIENKNVF